VALAALATYIMTLGYDFAFDDHYVIPVAWQVGAGSPLEALGAPVRAGEFLLVYFRPLSALTYWLDGFVWQGNPGGFHLTNVLLHALVSVLVLQVARRLLPAGPAPLLAGLLFAVYPVHVEAVAWVQGRVDLLSAAGVLLAVLLGAAGAEVGGRRRFFCWGASAIAFLLALMAKEVAIMAPLLTAIVLAGEPGRGGWRRMQACLPLFGLHGAALVLYLGLRTAALDSPNIGLLGGPSFLDRVLLALRVIPLYLRLLLWPVGLNPKHDVVPPSGPLDGGVLLGVAILAVLAATVVLCGRRVPGLGPGLAWLALAWLPTSNLIPIRGFVVAERYLYLPSVGMCIVLAGVTAVTVEVGCRWRTVGVAAAVLVLTFGGLTASQAGIWRDIRTFYEGLVRLNSNSVFAHNNLGAVYLGLGDEARAQSEFREALRLQPGHAGALSNLGILAQRRGDLVEARRLYREALAARPEQAEVWNNLGALDEAEGDLAGAATAYREAVRLYPAAPLFLANLAGILAAQERREEAASLFEQAVKLDPTVPRWQAALATLRAGRKP
jgi:Flp pilus assembly protein TadD